MSEHLGAASKLGPANWARTAGRDEAPRILPVTVAGTLVLRESLLGGESVAANLAREAEDRRDLGTAERHALLGRSGVRGCGHGRKEDN